MRKQHRRRAKIAYGLGIPAETFGCFTLKISGNSILRAENYGRLLQLTDTVVRLATSAGELRITGTGLKAAELEQYSLTLTGTIEGAVYGGAQ